MRKGKEKADNSKASDLAMFRKDAAEEYLTTNHGLRINDDQNTLKAGERGPSLLEDFHLREKITHFDHERIPERVVHARGAAAHGHFQVYESLAPYTKAGFLQDPSVKTPVFVRFSTVVGSRGSADLARDVRGFCGQVLYRGRKLRPGREQHSRLLHSGRRSSFPISSMRSSPNPIMKFRKRLPRMIRFGTSFH